MMKKFLVGFILGAFIFGASGVFADELKSLVGMKVSKTVPIVIDGERFSHEAILVNQRTYLPVRAAGEFFGFEVDYQDGTVILSSPKKVEEEEIVEDIQTTKEDQLVIDEQFTVEYYEKLLRSLQTQKEAIELNIDTLKSAMERNPELDYSEKIDSLQKQLQDTTNEIERIQNLINEQN